MAVDEQRFFRLLKLQAGERFFSGAAGGWEGSHFLYVLTTRSWDLQSLFFFGGKMSSKKPGKDVGSWNSIRDLLGDKHDFDGSARESTSEPVCKNSYWFHVNLSPSYMDIRRITCLDRMWFWGNRGHIWKNQCIYIYIYILHIQMP